MTPFDPKPVPHGGLHAGATERNREPILEVLRRVLPPRGSVLEIASGTGQHVAFFAGALPDLRWQPSDASRVHLDSIRAWCDASGANNIALALLLDVERQPWPVSHRRNPEHQHGPHRALVSDRRVVRTLPTGASGSALRRVRICPRERSAN